MTTEASESEARHHSLQREMARLKVENQRFAQEVQDLNKNLARLHKEKTDVELKVLNLQTVEEEKESLTGFNSEMQQEIKVSVALFELFCCCKPVCFHLTNFDSFTERSESKRDIEREDPYIREEFG